MRKAPRQTARQWIVTHEWMVNPMQQTEWIEKQGLLIWLAEVFSSLGKAGGCASAQLEGISRLISLTLRSGIDISSISKQLRAIRCPSVSWEQGRLVLSCADAIASVLEKYTSEETNVHTEIVDTANNWTAQCPECGNFLVFQEGCHICPSCGYTKCG